MAMPGKESGEGGILAPPMRPVNESDASSPPLPEGPRGLFGFPEFCDTFGRLSDRCLGRSGRERVG